VSVCAVDVEGLAATVEDTGGCYFVPAFSGLFCPYWQPNARGYAVGDYLFFSVLQKVAACNMFSLMSILLSFLWQQSVIISSRSYCDHTFFLSFLDKYDSDFNEIWLACSLYLSQMSVLTLGRSRSKVQHQNFCAECLRIVIAQPWFETSHQIWKSDRYCAT